MALTNLSQITTSGIATGTDLNIRNITGAAATFTGNVTVGGTLTYEDVTNIDSVGLITARSGISVTGGDVNLTSGNLALASATPMVVASNGSGHLRLGAGGSEKVRVKSDGKLGIGTDNPGARLHTYGGNAIMENVGGISLRFRRNDTSTAANRLIGAIEFQGNDSNGTYETGAIIRASSDKGHDTGDKPSRLEFYTTPDNSATPVERLRIFSDGQVAIATATNYAHVNADNLIVGNISDNDQGITIGSVNQGQIAFADSGDNRAGLIHYQHTDNSMRFYTDGPTNERLRITSDGKIGINDATPVTKLVIRDTLQAAANNHYSFIVKGDDNGTNGESAHIFLSAIDASTRGVAIGAELQSSANNHDLVFKTSNISATPTEKVRITSTGRVGIGTDNPNTKLQIVTTSGARALTLTAPTLGPYMVFETNSTPFADIGSEAGLTGSGSNVDMLTLNARGSRSLSFRTNSTERLRILANGKIGIGIDNPLAQLHINESSSTGYTTLNISNSATDGRSIQVGLGGTAVGSAYQNKFYIYDNTASAVRGALDSSGNFGLGTLSPAKRLNVSESTGGNLFRLSGLNNYNFDISNTNANGAQFDFYIGSGGGAYTFNNSNGELLRVTGTGDVGINCTPHSNAGINLHIHGDNTTSEIRLTNTTTGTGANGSYIQQAGNTLYIGNTESGNTVFEVNGSERLRITTAGNVDINGTPPWTVTGGNYRNLSISGSDASSSGFLWLGNGAATTNADFDLGRINFVNGANIVAQIKGTTQTGANDDGRISFLTKATGSSISEKVRIESDGDVRVYAGSLTVNKGNSAIQLSEYENGAAIWLDGANGDFSGGDYFNIRANNSSQLTFGYAGSEHVKLTTSGYAYFGGYPTSHTVAGSSPIKVRAGAGAWGISIGMRSSQNDYAYIGFTDMNGTEHIGEIFMQRTAASTGHMVFSTNDGSGSNNNRLRIGNSGRVCISPDASFAAESTNIAMSIACSGGDIGGYPGIHIRSTDSGGGTNSQNGMCIVSTDGNWSLYSNAGNVHGLGILTGNSANSNNTAFYARSDRKITMGPGTADEAHSTNTCGQAVHIAGGSLGLGALSNYSAQSGTGGRHVLGWYHANAFTNKGSNTHLHLVTSLWGGGSPHGQSEFMMGGFHIHGYKYHSSGISEEIIYFHNWSGSLANYSRHHHGNWDPGNSAYVNSSGYVTIKLSAGNYYGYTIDLMTFNWYPVRDIRVTSTTFNTGANL